MSSVVAVVKSIIGQVIAVSAEGVQRVLVEGDRIYQGDQLLTGAAGAVTLDVGNGKLVDLGRDSQWSAADLPQAEHARAQQAEVQAPSAEELQKAIAAGLDPTQALAPTAAGPSAGASAGGSGAAGGSHSFVMLNETAGRVDPNIGYDTAGPNNGRDASDERQGELPPNLAPEFTEGSNGELNLTTPEDTLLNGAFAARDPNGDTISYSVGQGPSNGQLVLNPNGTWQYQPNGDYNGADSFTVIVTDSRGASSTLTVNLGITPVNDAPVASGTYTGNVVDTAANDSFADIKGQLSATDVDDTNLIWSGSAKGAYGSLTVNPDGSYTYVVDANAVNALPLGQNPSESFTVTVTDPSGATDTRVITINIQGANDTPVAQDGQASGNEDSVIGGQLVATDRDTGSSLSFSTNGNPPAGFTLKPDGSWSLDAKDPAYQHLAEGETQVVQVPYTVTDEHGATSTATLTITLTGTNDAPVALPGSASTEENTVLQGQVPTATDVDGTVVGYQLTSNLGNGNGSLTFNADGSYVFNPGKDFDSLAQGETRDVTFTYQAKDNNGALSDPQTITITVTGTNDAPVAFADAQTTDENGVLNAQVPTATDVDGTVVGYQLTTDVAQGKGTLTFNADGSYSFNPGTAFDHLNVGQSETVTFTYQAKDNNGALSAPQTITITVTGSNDAAVITGQSSGSANETNAPVTIDGKLNITDVDSPASFQAQTDTAGSYGKFSITSDGTWTFVANSAYNELNVGDKLIDSFTVQAADGTTTTVTVTINGTNDAPVAFADTQTTDENGVLNAQVPTATDVDGTVVGYQLTTDVAQGKGTLTFNADGSYSFNPGNAFDHLNVGQSETVTFTYQAKDNNGALSDPQTITITVTGSNDAAVITGQSSGSANETNAPVTIDGKLNITDVDSPASFQAQTDTAGSYGKFSIAADGTWSYVANSAYNELNVGDKLTDSFTVQAADGTSTTVTVTINGTNDKPVAFADTQTTDENGVLNAQVPAGTDVDGTVASYQLTTDVAQGKGTLTFNADGSYSFNPGNAFDHLNVGQSETVTFTYQAKDNSGTLSDPQTITITVTGSNDKPVAFADSQTTDENGVLNAQVPTATDVDGSVVGYQLTTDVAQGKGTLTFNADGSYSFNPGSAFDHLAVGKSETVTFTYQAKDNDGALSDPQTITITVTGSNDAPVASATSEAVKEDSQINGQLAATDADDGAKLTYSLDKTAPAGFSVDADGKWSFDAGVSEYQHLKAGATQVINVPFTVTDEHGGFSSSTLTITITGTNDAPVADAISTNASEDKISYGKLTASDVDDGAKLSFSLNDKAPAGFVLAKNGTWVFNGLDPAYQSLAAGETKELKVDYTVTDEHGATDTNTLTITVTGTNDTPIAIPSLLNSVKEDAQINGTLKAIDVDNGAQLTFSTGKLPAGLTVGSDGQWSFNAGDAAYQHLKQGAVQVISVPFTVTDEHGAKSSSLLVITVTGTNDAPVANAATPVAATEDQVSKGQFTATDIDDGAKLSFSVDGTPPAGFTLKTDGSWTFDGNNSAYQSLAEGQVQTLQVKYIVTDEYGATDSKTLTITVTGTNDKPVAFADTQTTDENGVLNAQVPTATDVDGTVVGYQLATDVAQGKGTLTFNADGSYSFNPGTAFDHLNVGQSETVTFTYQAKDNNGALSDPQTITITVTGTNDAAVITGQSSGATDETNAPVTIDGKLNITDVDSPASFQAQTDTAGNYGKFSITSDGTWTFVANSAYNELNVGDKLIDSFTVQAADGTTTTVTVTINGTNDAPVAFADTQTTDENGVLNAQVPAGTDVDGTVASYQLATDVAQGKGTLTFNADGSYSFNPGTAFDHLNVGQSETVTFTYQAKDNNGALSDPQTITITVTGTNDAAVITGQSSGATDETNAPVTIDGKLNITDVDSPASFQAQTDTAGNYGKFSIGADGSWSYVANSAYNELNVGDKLTDSFTVQAADGTSTTVTVTINGTNDKPVAFADAQTTDENGVLNAQVPSGTDVDGTVASYQLTTDVAQGKGTLTFNADGSYSFNPGTAFDHLNVGQSETVTFTYQAKDNSGALSDPQTITITVTGSNDAAVITGQSSGSANETNAPVTIDGKLNITDVDSPASFQTQTDTAGSYGKFSIGADGSWSYVANSAYNELNVGDQLTDSFTVKAADGTTTSVTVTINGTNDAPVASADSQTTEENTILLGQVPAATDVDGTIASYQLATGIGGGKGTLTFNADGSYVFNPGTAFDYLAQGQTQDVTFTYQAKDNNGALSDPQTITITVTGTNDAAVISGQTTGSANETNAPVTIGGQLIVNDVDSPAIFQAQTNTAGDHGTFSITANGSWSYVANSAYNELNVGDQLTDTFTVKAADGTSTTVTVTINGTNDAPVAFADSKTTGENTVLQSQVPVAIDVDGTIASYQLASGIAQGKGTLTFNADGSYSFNPGSAFDHLNVGQSESVTFTYQAKDNNGALSDPQTITITVTGTNDKPVAYADNQSTGENTVLHGQVPVATDVDGSVVGYQLATDVAQGKGSLVFNSDGSYTFNPGTAFDHLATGQSENVTFTYQAKDNSGALSDPQTITITVNGTNDDPVANTDTAHTSEDTPVTIDVLGNDTDAEGDHLLVTGASATNGTVVINQDGTLTYSPKENFSGSDTITYTISDGKGGTATSTVAVSIEAVADKPNLSLDGSTSHPKATGLTVDTWTGLDLGTGGNGAAPATLQQKIDAAGTPTTHGSTDSVRNTDVTAGTATKVSGLIFLEAGHTYTFTGAGDDSVRLVIGGSTVAEATWGGSSGKFSGTYTPTESGYYPIALYQHNQSGPGNYTLSISDNGSAAQVLGTGSAQVFHNTSELTTGGERLSDLTGNSGQSHYKVFGLNEGNEDSAINLSHIKASLVDKDGSETLSVSIGKIPVGATLSDGTNKFTADATHDSVDLKGWNLDTLTLTPPENFNGTIKLEVSATATEQSNSDSATNSLDLNVTVYPVNDAPTVTGTQHLETKEDTPVSGQIHASDVDGDSLGYAVKNGSGPAHGSVTFGSDGSYTYTPAKDYNGSDSFTVVVSDGHGGSVEQIVTVGIAPVNDAPVFDPAKNTTTAEDTPLVSRVSATDVDGDSLTYVLKTAPTQGTIVLNADGSYTYTPSKDYNGGDSFTVTVNDGHGGVVDQVVNLTITPVNDAPTTSNQAKTTAEDTPLTGKIIASDVDGDTLSYALKTGSAPSHGSVTVNPTTGEYTYTPAKDYNGADSFTVRVSDGHGGTVDSVVNITITPVNDAPTTSDQAKTTAEDTPLTGKIVASDVDGDTLSYAVKTGVSHGTLVLNTATGDYTYTPAKDYNGSDSFTITVSDGHGGTVDSVVSLTITPVNDAPTTSDQAKTTAEDTPLTGKIIASDVDGDTLSYVLKAGSTPAHGTVALNTTTGEYTYTPAKDYNGADSFTVRVSDGHGGTVDSVVNITVTPVNDAPTTSDQAKTTAEDTPLTGKIVASDVDGDTLSYAVKTGVSHGTLVLNTATGDYTYTPAKDYNGSDSFTITVSDGHGGTVDSVVSLTITPVNDAPTTSDQAKTTAEDTPLTGKIVASDVDGDTLSYALKTGSAPSHGTVTVNPTTGEYTYTPAKDYNGADSFTVRVSDGHGGTVDSVVNITVTPVNDAPTTSDQAKTTAEDTPLTGKIVASDVDGDTLSYAVKANGAPAHGTLVLNPATGDYTYTPAKDYNGSDSFTITVSDGHGGTVDSVVSLTITPVNDAPTTSNQSKTTAEDTAVTGKIIASDVDGDTLSYALKAGSTPAHGTVTLNPATGDYTYTPAKDYNGSDSFTITVSDGHGGTVDSVVSLNITPVNDAPEAKNDAKSTGENSAFNGQVPAATDVDSTVNPNGYALVQGVGSGNGTLTFNANGSYSFNPGTDFDSLAPGESRQVTFTYTAKDAEGAVSAPATVTITVNGANDAPNGADKTITLDEDSSRSFSAADFGFSDVDHNDALSAVRIDSLPTNGTLKLNGSAVTAGQVIDAADLGKLVFAPAANANGNNYANFTFSVKDSNGAFDTTPNKLTFNVTPVNDNPVAVNDSFSLSGLKGNYWGYNEGPDGSNLTSLSQVTTFMNGHNPSATFTSSTLNYNLSGGDLGGDGNLQKFLGTTDAATLNVDPANTSDAIIQLTGLVNLNAGSYQFRVNADDGFVIRIDGKEVFKYDGNQSPTGRESAVFSVAESGNHQIEIIYWDQGGQAQLEVEMRPQGGTYSILGGTGLTHTVGELVTNEDTPLTIAPQTLLGNDSDVDGDSLSIVSVQGAVNGSVKLENGNVVFSPSKDFNGTGSFTYTISDGHGGTSTATVTVGVNAVNDAPDAKSDSKSTGENTAISGQVPAATDIDSAVDANGYALVCGPSAGTLTFNANGSYVYNPGTAFDSLNAGESRQVTFTYTAKDVQGAVSAPATVTITINGENDAPTGADKTVSLNEDGSRSFSAADFGFADKDAGDALKAIRIDNLPTAGSLTLNGQSVTAGQVIAVSLLASLVYTPIANAAGSAYATLKFSVQDSHDSFSSSSNTLTFTVNPVNDAPLSADGSASLYAGKTYTFGLKDFAFSDTADSANGQNHSLQNVLIKALPDSGSLLLNGVAVKAGQAISVSDVSSGKLTFVPDASGANAHFSFAVQDSGGTANGGVDTSPTYGFDLHVGQVQIPNTTPNGDNDLTGGSGDDVILGDVGGIKTLTQGGTNYNIALLVDTSGSMAYNLAGQTGSTADSRMKLVKDALVSLANELKGHDGIINIALIGFQSTASLKVSISDLTSANIDKLVSAINGLSATGGTDYQAAFEQAVSWFNGQTKGYTNLTLFLTDGDPTESKSYGDGTSTSTSIVKESAQAFVTLSGLSDVRAIGIGTNVNSDILKHFDNTSVTGLDTSMALGSASTTTLFTFNNNSALPGWTLSKSSTGSVGISGNKLTLTDTHADGASTAISSDLTVAKNTLSTFSFDFAESMSRGDTFTYTLQKYVDGAWSTVETKTLSSTSTNGTYTTGAVGEGTYHLTYVLTDTTNNSSTASATIDNLKQTTTAYAPTGEVDIVKQASDLTAALHGGSTSNELAPSGNDTIHGGAGDDIIFGDTINTDNLPWGVNGNPAKPSDMPAGSGVSALSAFLELKNGHAATSDEMYDYIKANHALFNVEGDTRGGSDHLYGGDGNDILYGQGGNDFLFGENGNDILIGGTGDDQLTGGKGNDILTGGAGADLFIWKAGDVGNDTITDFKAGEGDRIDISDLLPDTAHNDILSYLKVDTATSTLQVSTTGQINNGGAADVTIKLSGVDLSTYGSTSTEIVNKLVAGSDPVVKTEHH
ncbi:VCBS repeat-containing protein [Pseudomonas nitritireducens]|uniref:VCBS repeat-containing protein n=1 Tax=Pseudomonas nitroreducens TaxID=46680 RepID=A0A7W7NZC6_PSENT|nr:retention module-containing protein [Pseudomonas nitritireducens]MBB4862598.1 VCBS repeat-containing protein [Pseudomonas nitritireducens]